MHLVEIQQKMQHRLGKSSAKCFLLQRIHKVHKNYKSKKLVLKGLKTNLVGIFKATVTRTTRKHLGLDMKCLKVDLYEFL